MSRLTTSTTSVVDRFRGLDTAAVSDALDSLGVPGVLSGIAPRVPGAVAVGVAYTVTYGAVGETSTFQNAANYIDEVPPGSIIISDNAGSLECTTWGNILTAVAVRRDIAGTIVHGSARDIAEVRRLGYPLFSQGVSMVSGKNRVRLRTVGEDVRIGGVTVAPGDVVIADDSGAIRVPSAIATDVADRAWRVTDTEERIAAAVRDGSRLDEARARHGYARPWEA